MDEGWFPKVAPYKPYRISFETKLKGPSSTCWTIRIQWELSELLRVQSDSTPKTEFLNIAPEWSLLVSYESDFKNDSISRGTTLIHAKLTELRMSQVTPQNHTRVQKSARVQGWLKTTIIACIQWLHADIPAVPSVGSMVEVCAWLSGSTKNPYIEFRSSKNLEASPVS